MTRRRWTIAALGLTAAGLQATSPAHSNPPVDQAVTLEQTYAVPAGVAATLARACNDCHSNRTNWRWYTYVAPMSWFTVRHVVDGRAELNFSEFATYSPRMRDTRLHAICQLSEKGTMPLPAYVFVHREARLSAEEIRSVCAWTASVAELSGIASR